MGNPNRSSRTKEGKGGSNTLCCLLFMGTRVTSGSVVLVGRDATSPFLTFPFASQVLSKDGLVVHNYFVKRFCFCFCFCFMDIKRV